MPERIQMSRQHAWQTVPKAVVVSRPSKWGNPLSWTSIEGGSDETRRSVVVLLFANSSRRALWGYPSDDEVRTELAGKNLACWCPLDQSCHADVLLELANGANDG